MIAVIQNCNNRVRIEPSGEKEIPLHHFLERVNIELENFRSIDNIVIFLDDKQYTPEEFHILLNAK